MRDFLVGLSIALLLFLFVSLPIFYSAKVQAKLYNSKFGTTYTASDFFWAGTAIKKIHAKDMPNRPNSNVIKAQVEFK